MQKFIVIWFVVMGASSAGAAGWQDWSASDFSMQPPPAAGSAEARADLAAVLEAQASRTKAQCDQAGHLQGADFSLFRDLLSKQEFNRDQKLMGKVVRLVTDISRDYKKQFQRPRPADEDARVHTCGGMVGGFAYPSVHASVSAALGCVLSEVYPKRRKELVSYAVEMGELRVIAGYHHPKDVEAGAELGQDICQRLLRDQDFQSELSALD